LYIQPTPKTTQQKAYRFRVLYIYPYTGRPRKAIVFGPNMGDSMNRMGWKGKRERNMWS